MPTAPLGRPARPSGTVTLDGGWPSTARVEFVIDAAIVGTDHARRDAPLRNTDFFDVAQHPTITFVSRTVEPVNAAAGRHRATGDLTIRTVARSVTLDVQSPHRARTATRDRPASPRRPC